MNRSGLTGIAIGFFALFGAGMSCSREDSATESGSDSGPSVLLVTFDTTRADHLGPYGYRHAFTPTLDGFARESVLFNRAFSPAPLTLPSHCTIMTGLYPFYHGVRDNSHFVLNPGLNTLSEAFKKHGYTTAAFVSAFVLDSRFGLDQGFDTYDDAVRPESEFARFAVPERKAGVVTDAALDWLKSIDKHQSYFLWVHYYDPHAAYRPPDSFTRYSGHPYDEEIAYADMELGRLFDYVDAQSAQGRKTLTVFTSDHGESLGQYGEPTHAYFAYDATLHVPLMLKLPDGSHPGKKIDLPVGLADLMPTILDIVGLPLPQPDTVHGRSLTPLFASSSPPLELTRRPIAFEAYEPHYGYGWAPVQGVRVGETKLIDLPIPELYILSENPREIPSANRYEDLPDVVAELEAAYHDLFDGMLAFPPFTRTPLTPEPDVIEKLRALGYVSADLPERSDPSTGRDVKEMLPVYLKIMHVMSMISSGEYSEAAKLLVGLSSQDPENPRVLWLLAELAATTPAVADEALPVLESALASGRVSATMIPQMLVNCGRIHFDRHEHARALECFSDAIEAKENYAAAYSWLGLAHLRLGQSDEAIEAFRRARDLFGPDAAYAQATLGLAYFVAGRKEEGTKAWAGMLPAGGGSGAIWRLERLCSVDPFLAERIAPRLRRLSTVTSLPDGVRAVLALLCAENFSLLKLHEDALAGLVAAGKILSEDDPTLLFRMAAVHRTLGRPAEALRLLERARRTSPNRSDIVSGLAAALDELGRIDDAVDLLAGFYETHQNDANVANDLAWMLARQGKDLDKALKIAKRTMERLPANPNVNDTMGWVYHLRGDREMALIYLRRVTRMSPENATYHYHLGIAHHALGNLASAREAFARAVELAPEPRPSWFERAKAAVDGSTNDDFRD